MKTTVLAVKITVKRGRLKVLHYLAYSCSLVVGFLHQEKIFSLETEVEIVGVVISSSSLSLPISRMTQSKEIVGVGHFQRSLMNRSLKTF